MKKRTENKEQKTKGAKMEKGYNRGTDIDRRAGHGAQVSRINRKRIAIYKRRQAGEDPTTHKKLAELMDSLYGTDFVGRYHSQTKGGR